MWTCSRRAARSWRRNAEDFTEALESPSPSPRRLDTRAPTRGGRGTAATTATVRDEHRGAEHSAEFPSVSIGINEQASAEGQNPLFLRVFRVERTERRTVENARRRVAHVLHCPAKTARRFVHAFFAPRVRRLADAGDEGQRPLQRADDLPDGDLAGLEDNSRPPCRACSAARRAAADRAEWLRGTCAEYARA